MTDDTQTPPQPGKAQAPQLGPPPPWLQRWEIVAVLAVSLGASALYALLSFIGSLTAKQSLSHQTATLNGSLAPGRPLLDLFMQLLNITLSLAPVFLVFYLLARSGERPSSIGVDARAPGPGGGGAVFERRGRPRAGPGPGPRGRAGRGHRRRRPGPVPDRVPRRRRAERRGGEPARHLVADPGAAAVRAAERHLRRSHHDRLPAEQAGPARRQARPGDRAQRGNPRLVPSVPRRRRLPRPRRHGPDLGLPLPPLGPGDAADHRALPDRRGDLRRLRAAGRPRVLAAKAMSVLARLWDRVSGSPPLPPAWVIGLTGLLALCVVLNSQSWRVTGKVITIAHEGGHALVSVLSGRRLDGIRLHSDSSGVTYSRGRRTAPGLVLTAAAGYVMPSLLGAGAACLLAAGHLTAMLWLALFLLAATFLAIRNAFGALAVLVTAGGVFAVSYYAPAAVQAGFAYLAVWFLLFGGLRPVVELAQGRHRRWSRGSDAAQLARLTGAPAGLWITLFMLVAVAALVAGAALLVPPGWHLGLPSVNS